MDAPFLRIDRFTTAEDPIIVDAALRDRVLPCLTLRPGLRAAWAGRRGVAPTAERLLATAWDSREAALAASGSLCGIADGLTDQGTIVAPVVLCERFERPSPPRILRVYEGVTRPGELDAYVAEAHAGVLLDGASPDGPVSVCMAVPAPDRFVTVSTWTDWECLARCTGGDIARPLATRNAARLAGGGPTHLELLGPA